MSDVGRVSTGGAAVVGYVILVLFCGCYLVALPSMWNGRRRRFWSCYAAAWLLMFAEMPFAHSGALWFCVYIAAMSTASMGRQTLAVIGVLMAIPVIAPVLLPFWHEKPNYSGAWSVGLAAVATWGFFTMVRSNIALSEARAEVARLAAENERSRIARDLHDLLGQSLTAITVKASLASRIATIDPQRSIAEIAEVETLTRRALADVRAAVSGFHQVSLAGELASAREVLRAAGIEVSIPYSTDAVPEPLQELFGWVVREGITNTVRHSRATHCTIILDSRSIEISDDGRAGLDGGGAGLPGLRNRIAEAGGTLTAGPNGSTGWRLRAEFPIARSPVESPADPPPACSPPAGSPPACSPPACSPPAGSPPASSPPAGSPLRPAVTTEADIKLTPSTGSSR